MSESNGNGKPPLPDHIKRMSDRRGHFDRGQPIADGLGGYCCGACGRMTDEQGMALSDEAANPREGKKRCGTCFGGLLRTPDHSDPETALVIRARGIGRKKKPRISDMLEQEARDRVDRIFKPYWEILDMEPNPEWSERTKLDFKQGQVSVSEKLLNRIDGLPTQRIRNVDRDDNDVTPQVAGLPGAVQERLLVNLLMGRRDLAEEVRADIESTATEVPEEDQ